LFSMEEAYAAREAFITSATTFVMPVTSIDGKPVGDGKPGDITLRLREIYIQTMLESIA
jgi:D-alanine transaminase